MDKNTAGKWTVYAFGSPAHATLAGLPITGDAANITANIRIDGGVANAVDDTNPTELEDGYYIFDITAAEANGDQLTLCPASATANVLVIGVPGAVWTRPAGFNTGEVKLAAAQPNKITFADGIVVNKTTANEPALDLNGNGTGAGLDATGGATGHGISANAGASSGHGIFAHGRGAQAGMHVEGGDTNGAGFSAQGGATNGRGINALGVGTGNDFTGDIAGNLSGSVGSVTGAVGSVTAAVTVGTINAGVITATSIAAAALNGKGDWNIGKTGYTLVQTFPTNFADLAITVTTGQVTVGTNNDKTGYSVSTLAANVITAASIAAAALNGKGDWNIGKTGYSISGAITTLDGLNNLSAANVLTQVNAALDTAIAELGVGVPTATPTIRTGLMLLYMALRNQLDVTTSGSDFLEVHNDAGTVITKKALTDSGGDYSEAKMVTGP